MTVGQSAQRIAIYHRNVKHMIRQIMDKLSNTNVANMSNTSRGEYAYTMIDLDETIRPETVAEIGRIPDVLRVRVVK